MSNEHRYERLVGRGLRQKRARVLARWSLLTLVALQLCLLFRTDAARSGETVFPEPANASAADVEPGWWARVRDDIAASEYRVTRQEKTPLASVTAAYQAPNRAHNLRTWFTDRGIRLVPREGGQGTPDSWELGLTLTGFGREDAVRPVEQAGEPTVAGGRVAYARGDLTEWYVNDARGLEQGFTVAEPPPGEGKLCVQIAVQGDLTPGLASDGQAMEFRADDATTLRYGGLRAWDAQQKDLPVSMSLHKTGKGDAGGDEIRLSVDATDATYPVTIDPTVTHVDWTAESDQEGAQFGYSVSGAGDVNGDGYADVVVGAPHYDDGETDEGEAFVYLGSASGLGLTAAWTAEGDHVAAEFGFSVSGAGDVNGDGFDDVIVGAPYYDDGETDEGWVFVYLGSATGLDATAAWTAESDQIDFYLGESVSGAGDVNGDGYGDVIVGAPRYDNGQTEVGGAYVYYGSASGLDATAAWSAEGDQEGAGFGISVSEAGDVNGDGYDDVIVGAHGYDTVGVNEGRAYVYFGSESGLGATAAWSADGTDEMNDNASFGYSVSGAGDVNGDGFDDVIVGAHIYRNGQEEWEGGAFVYHGSASGLGATPAWIAEGNYYYAAFGYAVSSAGTSTATGSTTSSSARSAFPTPRGPMAGPSSTSAPLQGWTPPRSGVRKATKVASTLPADSSPGRGT